MLSVAYEKYAILLSIAYFSIVNSSHSINFRKFALAVAALLLKRCYDMRVLISGFKLHLTKTRFG